MATYTSDLTSQVVSACDVVTGWTELPSPHASGSAPSADTENFIHNAASVSQPTGQASGQGAGIQFDYGSNLTWTATSNWCVFFWTYYTAPTNITSWSTGGFRVGVGSADNNAEMFNAAGIDFGLSPYACWQNTAIDPEGTSDQTIGTVTAAQYQNFAILPNVNAKITKGNPIAVDVVRYGRGQLLSTGTACTFTGMATFNDNSTTGRYGLFSSLAGAYRWKGLMQFGDASTTCTFSDSNKAITVEDTPRVLAGFNKIEVYHASSSITWTSISISGVQTSITGSAPVSPGDFEAVANATIAKTGCTFTDMGSFIYQSNSTVTDSVFRRCGEVTVDGAAIEGTIFDNPTGTTAVNAVPTDIGTGGLENCTFNSDGTGYAVDLGTGVTTQTINWNNDVTSYASSDGSTGNEVIKVAVADDNTLTINANGTGTVSVHNASTGNGAVSVVTGQVDLTIEVKKPDTTALTTEDANVYVTAAAGGTLSVGTEIIKGFTNTSGIITDTRSYVTDQPITGWVRKMSATPYYKEYNITGTVDTENGLTVIAVMISDE